MILTQDSNYMGAWNVSASQTLQVDADARLGAASNPVTLVGTFASTASFSTSRVFTMASGGIATFDTATGTTLTLNDGLGPAVSHSSKPIRAP